MGWARRTLASALAVGASIASGPPISAETSEPADPTKVEAVVAASSCRNGPFKAADSGTAPRAFLIGLGLTYLKSVCALRTGVDTAAQAMSEPVSWKPIDIFSYYGDQFERESVSLSSAADRVRALYALAVSVGMNESDGNPTEGPYIKTNQNRAEAGLFQMSYDSLTAHPPYSPWLSALYRLYQIQPDACLKSTFMHGIIDENKKPIGQGEAKQFQMFTKACPAFATEYAMVMLRADATYFGTVIATNPGGHPNKALFVSACYKMLSDLEPLARCTD
jgi:hypothetical protein